MAPLPDLNDFETVGKYLQAVRQYYGEHVDDLARDLKLQRTYLRAIEAGEYQRLPGRAYAVGFVRAYAAHYGLDTMEIVEHFKNEAEPSAPSHKGLHVQDEESKLPRGRVAMLSIAMAALLYGTWFVFSNEQANVIEPVAEPPGSIERDGGNPVADVRDVASSQEATTPSVAVPPTESSEGSRSETETTAGLAPSVAPSASNQGAETASEAGVTREALAPTSPSAEAAESALGQTGPATQDPASSLAAAPGDAGPRVGAENNPPSQAPDGAQVALAPAGTPTEGELASASSEAGLGSDTVPTLDGALPEIGEALAEATPAVVRQVVVAGGGLLEGEGDLGRIILRATADSWIRVRAPDRSTYWTGIMKRGDALAIPDAPGYRMNTGNAGAIDFIVDDQIVDPVGPSGAVRRNVVLEAVPLMQGTAYTWQPQRSPASQDGAAGTRVVPWRNPDEQPAAGRDPG